jgi:hypothetical protein
MPIEGKCRVSVQNVTVVFAKHKLSHEVLCFLHRLIFRHEHSSLLLMIVVVLSNNVLSYNEVNFFQSSFMNLTKWTRIY